MRLTVGLSRLHNSPLARVRQVIDQTSFPVRGFLHIVGWLSFRVTICAGEHGLLPAKSALHAVSGERARKCQVAMCRLMRMACKPDSVQEALPPWLAIHLRNVSPPC